MFVPLKVTTDYTLLKSTIKMQDLVAFLKENNLTSCAICDENLYGVMDFYQKMVSNGLRPIIGLSVTIDNYWIYLYAKDYQGYQNLLKIHSLKEFQILSLNSMQEYLHNIKIILPFNSYDLLDSLPDAYLGYSNNTEKMTAFMKSEKVVYVRDVRTLEKDDTQYLSFLEGIDKGVNLKEVSTDYS
ncbi:MAG: PHP domain-containing protein, partial [Bacilli bacterium]|nr:PHP domain-containing protein [Bacilli bacterium]